MNVELMPEKQHIAQKKPPIYTIFYWTSVSDEESKSMLDTVILSVCQVIPPSVDLKAESVTPSRLMTFAKFASAALRVTVRLVISVEILARTSISPRKKSEKE